MGDSATAERVGRRRRRRRWILGPLLGLLGLAAIGSLFIPLPYYALSPGSVRTTEDLITVTDAEIFPSDGEVLFTTVALRQVTVWGALEGWLDSTIDVVPDEQILGDRDAAENREINLELMDTSKQTAAEVAFEHLGCDVASGTGAIVSAVDPELPAGGAVAEGDVIVAVDDEPVTLSEHVVAAIESRGPGDEVTLSVENVDGTDPRDETVVLAARTPDSDMAILGVAVNTRDLELDFPFPVDIDSGDVGGPSAGLAFTLALLDLLTPGELTGGSQVAVTGTINGRGDVGPVGGVTQKTAAAERAGAELFVVPSVELDDARAVAGDLQVEAADTLDEALDVLAPLGGNSADLVAPDELTEACMAGTDAS